MTDYNDGKWHGWNGGECPVHPESVVEWVLRSELTRWRLVSVEGVFAKTLKWQAGSDDDLIVAFRVIRPYAEPRELWMDEDGCVWDSKDEAMAYSPSGKPRLFREVKG